MTTTIPERRPEWLRVRPPKGENYENLKQLMRSKELHTVCEEARCPNIGECCLRHAVVTSVNRDELKDGGAAVFAATIRWIRRMNPQCKVEVLTPDFKGDYDALRVVIDAKPDVFNHNVETVPRLYKRVRPQAVYKRSLQVLKWAKEMNPAAPTKSGFMLGLGETWDEVIEVMHDMHEHDVDILTIGQYLRPSFNHLPIARYAPLEEYAALKAEGKKMGFRHVESGPFVRSSYHAHEQADGAIGNATVQVTGE